MTRPPDPNPVGDAARLRRAVSALIRDTRFSGSVLDAYMRRCAMCGLGLNLVQGAHIYPASARARTTDRRTGSPYARTIT